MGSGFVHPSRRITVTDQVKKPPQERETIAFSKTEPEGMWTQRVGECAWIVVDGSHRLDDKARDGFRVLAITEEVGGDSGWPRYR
jgi:hypothetical protein